MEWNVYRYDSNSRTMKVYNVLAHMEPIIKQLKKKFETKEEFADKLKSELMYYYWSKSEHEIVISAWCGGNGKEAKKIDVYEQVRLNWSPFVDYCWNFHHKYQRKKVKD